ncbi:MAG: hypothetical protein V2A78_07660 [bacterium]
MLRKRTIALLALLVFLVVFTTYFCTLSLAFEDDSPYYYVLIMRGPTLNEHHLLWFTIEKFLSDIVSAPGSSVNLVQMMKWTNAASGALACVFVFLLLLSVTVDASFSFLTALIVAFSQPLWNVCTHGKLYALSGFLVVTFYCLFKANREGSRRPMWVAGLTHALAVLANNLNGLLIFVILAGIFFPGRRSCLKDRIVPAFHYLAAFVISLILFVPLIMPSFHMTGISDTLKSVSSQVLARTQLGRAFMYESLRVFSDIDGVALRTESLLLFSVILFVAVISLLYLLPGIRARLPWRFEYALCLLWLMVVSVSSFFAWSYNFTMSMIPLGILCGLGFALMAKSTLDERAALLRRRIVLSVFAAIVLATVYLNATGIFLPASKGLTDPLYGPVAAYASLITPNDFVITSDFGETLYFSYFLHCKVRNVSLNDYADMQKPEAFLEDVTSALNEGQRVYLHKSPYFDSPHYILNGPSFTFQFAENLEHANLDAKSLKSVRIYTSADLRHRLAALADLVLVSKYSEHDSLLLLKLRSNPAASPGKKR